MNVADTLKFDWSRWVAAFFGPTKKPSKLRLTKSKPSKQAIRARRKRERQARKRQQRAARLAA